MQQTKTTAEIKKFSYEVGEGYILLVKLSEELKRLEKIYRIDIQFDCSPIKEIDGVINSADCIFHYGNFAYRDTEKYLEIIGNIHENPELINR